MASSEPTGKDWIEGPGWSGDARFRSIFETTGAGIAVARTDGTLIEVNQAFCRMLGYDREELLGLRIVDVTHHEDREDSQRQLTDVMEGRRETIDLEKRYVRKDGSFLWGHITATWIRDSDGRPRMAVGLIQDVTARKQTERELWRIQRALRRLHTITTDAQASRGDKIRMLLDLGCEQFGLPLGILSRIDGERYTVEAVIDAGDMPVAEGAGFELDTTYCRDVLRTGEILCIEHAGQSDWKTHPCYLGFSLEAYIGVPIRVGERAYGTLNFSSPKPRQLRFSVADREILELMAEWLGGYLEKLELREQLLERERLATIGSLSAKLAHEIGNPLQAIHLNLEPMRRRLATVGELSEDLRGDVDLVASEVERLRDLLREFGQLSAARKPRLQPVDLGDVVKAVLDTQTELLERSHVLVEFTVPRTLPAVSGDPKRLTQVLVNLIKNAVEAMPDGGTLRVAARPVDDRVAVEIIDSGAGIPDDIDVFEPFATTKPEGTGLGLSIVRQIIAAHRGQISIASVADGGTTVEIVLPLAEAADDDDVASTATPY